REGARRVERTDRRRRLRRHLARAPPGDPRVYLVQPQIARPRCGAGRLRARFRGPRVARARGRHSRSVAVQRSRPDHLRAWTDAQGIAHLLRRAARRTLTLPAVRIRAYDSRWRAVTDMPHAGRHVLVGSKAMPDPERKQNPS